MSVNLGQYDERSRVHFWYDGIVFSGSYGGCSLRKEDLIAMNCVVICKRRNSSDGINYIQKSTMISRATRSQCSVN